MDSGVVPRIGSCSEAAGPERRSWERPAEATQTDHTTPVSLLQEIQASATDRSQSVSDLLRRCQILAYRLQHESLKTWVAYELNGYPAGAELPDYRRERPAAIRANLSGPFQSFARDVQVPVTLLPQPWRDQARLVSFTQAVGELESMVEVSTGRDDPNFRSEIPAEVFANIAIYQGYSTVQMWTVIPATMVAGVIDQIRTRALTFALELEALDPQAGDSPASRSSVSSQSITQIFNAQVLGGTLNWAAGTGGVTQTIVNVVPGDFDSLAAYLRQQGVDNTELTELRGAVDADAVEGVTKEPGPRVRDWIGKVTLRLAQSGSRITEGATGALIAEAILRFLSG